LTQTRGGARTDNFLVQIPAFLPHIMPVCLAEGFVTLHETVDSRLPLAGADSFLLREEVPKLSEHVLKDGATVWPVFVEFEDARDDFSRRGGLA